jgi:hypothetical protein
LRAFDGDELVLFRDNRDTVEEFVRLGSGSVRDADGGAVSAFAVPVSVLIPAIGPDLGPEVDAVKGPEVVVSGFETARRSNERARWQCFAGSHCVDIIRRKSRQDKISLWLLVPTWAMKKTINTKKER